MRKFLAPAALAFTAAVLGWNFWDTARCLWGAWTGTPASFTPIVPAAVLVWTAHAGKAAGVLLFFAAIRLLGARLRRLFPAGSAFGLDPFFADAALGLIAWSLLGFGLAAAGLSRPAIIRGVSAFLLVGLSALDFAGERLLIRDFNRLRAAARVPVDGVTALLVLVALVYGALTLLPETFCDSLVYVLPLPERYLAAGRMMDMPANLISRYPGFVQTLYMWILAWSDDRACRIFNAGLGGLWAAAVGVWSARRWSAAAGRWAALILLSSPFVGSYLWSCTFDMSAGFFAFASFAAWEAAKRAEGAHFRRAGFFLAGIFLGAAGASKYTAAFGGLYYLLDGLLISRRACNIRLREGALFALGGFLPLAPWWARNAVYCGNPFYPYAVTWLRGTSREGIVLLKGLSAEQWRYPAWGRRLTVFFVESVRGALDGRFGFIGPLFLMAAPGAFISGRARTFFRSPIFLYAAFAYLVFSAATGWLRYYMPHLGILAAGAGAGLVALEEVPAWGRIFRAAALAAAAGLALSTAVVGQVAEQGWSVVSGRVSAAEFLRQPHTMAYKNPSQGAFDFLRENGATFTDKTYVIGETRLFRCPTDAEAPWLYDVPRFAKQWGPGAAPDDFILHLRAAGFRYVLFNLGEFTWAVAEPYRTPEWTKRLSTLFDRLSPPIYRDPWCVLFRIPHDDNS
jgi:hypothetical protein